MSSEPVGDIEYWELERVLNEVEDGDARGWRNEAQSLWKNNRDGLVELIADVSQVGILDAIDVAWTGSRWRMWDGHHRVIAAAALCVSLIPVRLHSEVEIGASDE